MQLTRRLEGLPDRRLSLNQIRIICEIQQIFGRKFTQMRPGGIGADCVGIKCGSGARFVECPSAHVIHVFFDDTWISLFNTGAGFFIYLVIDAGLCFNNQVPAIGYQGLYSLRRKQIASF